MAVSPKKDYALIEIYGGEEEPFKTSRMILIELNGKEFTTKATLDCFDQQIGFKYSLDCFGYVGNYLIWVGLSVNDGNLHLYEYEVGAGELRELENKRRRGVKSLFACQLHRMGSEYFYTGNDGNIMKVKLRI